MPNYKAIYFQLAAKVAAVIDILIEAQQKGEAADVEGEPLIVPLKNGKSNDI